jgi:hypothetical protein
MSRTCFEQLAGITRRRPPLQVMLGCTPDREASDCRSRAVGFDYVRERFLRAVVIWHLSTVRSFRLIDAGSGVLVGLVELVMAPQS